ncbi:peflin-like isoform X2 [Sitophilus oryzae]|uniref:Peflin-like isoform X2 n=1 Tax=Sitophilus oryzae TaxID=7048 RepID=A0A6J2XBC0_SITOR|nr:peflin-like isoform X2 [Sitophilus oryzae]
MYEYATAAASASPEISQWFQAVDRDRSGEIKWEELQSALINAQGEHFSDAACKLMIGMFDKDKTGTINVNEFQALYNYINQWLSTFKMYDRDQSGSIEESELSAAYQHMGFRFSPEFIHFLVEKSDLKNHKTISIDQFILTCIQLQRFTEAFRQRDSQMRGEITIGFEDYLTIVLNCSS